MKHNYIMHYNNWHSDSDESKNNDIKTNKYIIEIHKIMPRNKNDRVLDLGCGMGRFLLALREMGYTNLTGVEINNDLAGICRKDGLNVICSDVLDFLMKETEPYDVIYLSDVLEHIENDKQIELLAAIYRNLSESGFLYISVPNACSPIGLYFRYIDWTHLSSFTETSLSYVLRNAGFDDINIREMNPPTDQLFQLREPFRLIYGAELGKDHENPIMSLNLAAVVYKKKSFDNIYIDRLWATNEIRRRLESETAKKIHDDLAGNGSESGRNTLFEKIKRLFV